MAAPDTPTEALRTVRQEKLPPVEGLVEVAPGVGRLQLTIAFPGLGHVNCYVLEDERGVALVDPGLPGAAPWKELTAALRRAGLDLTAVHTVVITHSHPDHFGAAARLRAETGAEIVTHTDFKTFFDPDEEDDEHKELTDGDLNAWSAAKERLNDLRRHVGHMRRWSRPTPWGGAHPRPDRRTRTRYAVAGVARRSYFRPPTPSSRVVDGEVLVLGRREWVALHTPGHTVDHLCLLDPAGGVLMSGDHVLPTITPHISGLVRAADPLRLYFDSLERLHTVTGVTTVLPAHGLPFDNLHERAKAIQEHHRERLELLRAAGSDLGEASVEDYSQRLFKPASWGSMADSETYAHLEHLVVLGEASRRQVGSHLRYRLIG